MNYTLNESGESIIASGAPYSEIRLKSELNLTYRKILDEIFIQHSYGFIHIDHSPIHDIINKVTTDKTIVTVLKRAALREYSNELFKNGLIDNFTRTLLIL